MKTAAGIFENPTPEEIVTIISKETGEECRLRSSSSFAGVLSEGEREKIGANVR